MEQALRTHIYTTVQLKFKTSIGHLKQTAGVTIPNLITVVKET